VCGVGATCAPGLVCCYPCGTAGCDNQCALPCDESHSECLGGCIMYP
jgi:hypothetical protein